MKVYQTNRIRNVAIIGNVNSGKTTLTEALLFEGGVIDRRGTVEAKNTVSDYHEIEHEKMNSIKTSIAYTEWADHKINILDTPGFDDFVGEVLAAMKVTEASIMTINAQNGVEVGTEIYWRWAKQRNVPVMFVVNQLDHEKANFDEFLKESREYFSDKIAVVQYPLNSGKDFNTIVDVLNMEIYKFPENGGTPEISPVPESEREKAEELHNLLVESAAENEESLMEIFFDKGTLTREETWRGLKTGLLHRNIFPVFCVSAKKNIGTQNLMDYIIRIIPSTEAAPGETNDGKLLAYDSSKPATALVFKTSYEEHLGEVSHMKIYAGEITEGMEMENFDTSSKEKLTQLFIVAGRKREKVEKVVAGDIAASIKLKNTKTNNTLNARGTNIKVKPVQVPEPRYRTAIKAKNAADDEKLAGILNRMHAEDPTFIFEYSKELKQMLIHGQGELHINIAKWHLDNEYKIPTDFLTPKIPYRETITKQALADYRHKKQSGGAGQFGEVYLMVEPYEPGKPDPEKKDYSIRGKEEIELPWGGKLIYYNAIVGGVIDARFLPAILKGLMEKMEEGPLTGSYARDIRVVVYDGKMHPVDSNEISFKLAGRNAFAKAFKIAGPKLLEPVYRIEVFLPEGRMGDVMTDLQGRRAMILGMEGEGVYQKIIAKVPLAEMNKYSTTLSSLTNGRASYTMKFDEYAQVPPDIQEKLLKEYEASQKEEDLILPFRLSFYKIQACLKFFYSYWFGNNIPVFIKKEH